MAFANLFVLGLGGLLMSVPILLHLLMKQRPRHQVFPAMRFLRRRQIANKRQLRLRNWLLLALRLAAIGLFALLLARPSVDTLGLGYWIRVLLLAALAPLAVFALGYAWLEKKSRLLLGALGAVCLMLAGGLTYNLVQAVAAGRNSTIGDDQAPVASVLVFDTSPRMGLRHDNKTRLDEARSIARDLIKQLPTDSEVAVADASNVGTTFSVDVGNAVNMVESLRVVGSEFPLHELVMRGIESVKQRDDKRKEVFVFTDLSQVSWQVADYRDVARQLAERPDVALFVIDVGVTTPRNVRLGPLRLGSGFLVRGRPLRLEVDVHSLHVNEEVSVEILVEEPDPIRPVIVDGEVLLPRSTPRGRKTAKMVADSSAPLEFLVGGLPPGIQHGQVRVSTEDGLAIDNTRYFTIEVQPPRAVLILTADGAKHSYLEFVLSPYEARQKGNAWFDCQVRSVSDLPQLTLADYDVVALLDPTPLPPDHWRMLHEFVADGGGLAVFLGRNAVLGATVDDFNAVSAAVLPGPLHLLWRAAEDYLFISPRDTSHPLLRIFRDRESAIPWDDSPVFRHWSFAELRPGANVVTRFSNDKPALVESVIGDGRVLTMTTPISDARNNPERPAWNHLPTVEQPLPFFMLMREMFVYLSQQNARPLNYSVGQVVSLSVDAAEANAERTWQLFTPTGDWQNTRSVEGQIVIASTDDAGTYRLKPNGLGFSVNLSESATDLKRLPPEGLDEVLGEKRYTLARGATEVDRGVGRARVGRELYPFLLLLVIGVVAMEQLMSNRFYGVKSTS